MKNILQIVYDKKWFYIIGTIFIILLFFEFSLIIKSELFYNSLILKYNSRTNDTRISINTSFSNKFNYNNHIITNEWWTNARFGIKSPTKIDEIIIGNYYKLVGTIKYYNIYDLKYCNKAIISVKNIQNFYEVNDIIDYNVRLYEIGNDFIIIGIDNIRKTIYIDFSNKKTKSITIIETNNISKNTNIISKMFKIISTNKFGVEYENNHYKISRKKINEWIDELKDDPERLANLYDTMKPNKDFSGKTKGYTISSENEKEFFNAIGLKEGDTLKSINRMNLLNDKRCEYLISSFVKKKINKMEVYIERNNKYIPFNYEFED